MVLVDISPARSPFTLPDVSADLHVTETGAQYIPIIERPSSTEVGSDGSAVSDNEDAVGAVDTTQPSKKVAQRAAFDEFLNTADEPHDVVGAASKKDDKDAEAEERVKIIDKVRDYQQELFERAKSENVIAVLDTGSGKTLIACLLIKHTLAEEILHRDRGEAPRVVVFLANSVHLAQQQARVLHDNLVTEPFLFCGNDKIEIWRLPLTWTEVLAQTRPVVCTPAILQQCLDAAVLRIDQISLLVFDEAHHAKKNHPYSRIIRSYYLACPSQCQPRIFGMTASPVDSKGNIDTNAADLEQLLHSKIITTSDLSLTAFAPKPEDVMWNYDRLRAPFCTELHAQLWRTCSFAKQTKRGFTFSTFASAELGPWCADRVWKYIFGHTENESAGLIKRYEQGEEYASIFSVYEREVRLQQLCEASSLIQQYGTITSTPPLEGLSSKVIRLFDGIKEQYIVNPNTRTIVFVEQQLTAHVLKDCFSALDIPHLRCDVLLGNGAIYSSLKQQEQVLQHFRAGLVNLVFATSVADEGIDIPQCNLCVRFDLYKSPIQYMQSRGRARMASSVYVHLVEEHNQAQQATVQHAMDSDAYIKEFCQSLPADRLLGRGTRLQRMIQQDNANLTFKTASGAECNFGNSLLILAKFASSLAHIGALTKEIYEEEIDDENRLFRYVVRLPPNSETEIKGARGEWRQNKQLAKRSAAFNCCWLLRGKGKLDENLESIFRKVKPKNINARLAVSKKKSSYEMLVKPSQWSRGLEQTPESFFASTITFESEARLQRPLLPLVLLTREPLPRVPSFSVFVENNIRTQVMITNLDRIFPATPADVQALTRYTLEGVFLDVFNKMYELDAGRMSYWLAPLATASPHTAIHLADLVDMKAVHNVQLGRLKWSQQADVQGSWTNKFICDPRNGKFHYFSGDIAPGISIFDPVPDTVPHISQKKRKHIIDFSDSSWSASKKNFVSATYDHDQPVMHAELLMTRRNFLDTASEKESKKIMCLIAPQPLEVSRVSSGIIASCFVWPSIIHRLESYMTTLEAFDILGLQGVSTELALEAFTKDNDNDDDEEQTHFSGRRGMGKNYERLEFIGDSLLKMMTTITVFLRTKCDEEGMHCRRMEILCNRRLFDVSTEKHHLYRYAKLESFNRDTWYPENLVLLKGRGVQNPPQPVKHPERTQELGMKTIADFSEAIIGAAVTSTNHLPNATKFDLGIKAISILVDSPDHDLTGWADLSPMYSPPEWCLPRNDVQANKLANDIFEQTGYRFNHPRLLRSAFTHSSDTNATVPDLQRLEFLGDAVLDWVCISWLYDNNPNRNPQWLTEHKMAMVSNKFLAALAVTLNFDKFMYCATAALFADITTYARQVREQRAQPDCPRDFWTTIEHPPKALSDLVESYLGAVLVDSNFTYAEIETFFTNHILWFFNDISVYDGFASHHPTSFLYKKFHDEFKCRDFSILASEPEEGKIEVVITAGVVIHGQVAASSKGTSAKYAKVRASRAMLQIVEGWSIEEFRRRYGCGCKWRAE